MILIKFNQRIKLTDITRIEHLTDKENNHQFLIQLFVLKVILCFFKDNIKLLCY